MIERPFVLKERHTPGAVYTVHNRTGILQAAHKISTALTVVRVPVGMMALIISGVSIMNIMLVTVRERTREIGVRKAIGARRDEILYQFLIEALIIGGVGTLIGIAIAIGIKIAAEVLSPRKIGLRVPISTGSVIAAFVVSCGTGLLFGFLPARAAAKLEPIESLRYE